MGILQHKIALFLILLKQNRIFGLKITFSRERLPNLLLGCNNIHTQPWFAIF